MKKMINIALAVTALGCLSLSVAAEEEVTYSMTPDTVYELDLQGDGTLEKVSYQTYTAGEDEDPIKCQAVLELYVNDQLVQTLTDETWSYSWSVDQCPMEDGTTLLLASSRSDNDWTNQSLLLSSDGTSFETIADLGLLSREGTEEDPSMNVGGWGRCRGIAGTEGNQITVSWMDALKATGNCLIEVTYILEDGVLTESDNVPVLDPEQTWTAWQPFTVYTEIGDAAEVAFQAEVGDVVQLSEIIREEGNVYFKCTNADGIAGWMPDAAEYISEMTEDGTDFRCGYFEEAIYAG